MRRRIAGYQQGLPWMSKGGDTPLAAKIALCGGREVVGLLIVSLLAGTATIPYIAYHFHRISPYGVVANLIAMPVVSVWIMPVGILGPDHHAARSRQFVLEADGRWHRLDDLCRAVGHEFSRSAGAR